MVDNNAQEHVLLITTCFEKSVIKKDRLCVLIVTPSRIIIFPLRDPVPREEQPLPAPGGKTPAPLPVPSRGRWVKAHPVLANESFDSLVKEYRDREPGEILSNVKDAHVIQFDQVLDIDIQRVRNDLRYSRWLSVFFLSYSCEPASAHYAVDYHLTILTPAGSDMLLTPFLLKLKQILVDQLGDRVHETIDSTAPLL